MPRWKRTLGDLPADAPRLLLVRFQRRGNDRVAQDRVLAGDYSLAGTNHGKPVYQKRRKHDDDDSPDVLVYFWQSDYDDRDTVERDDPGCWWMGQKVGGEAVWAVHEKVSHIPPVKGWRVVDGGDPDLELVVTEAAEKPLSPKRRQSPAKPARPNFEKAWDPPAPWRAIAHEATFYYWNDAAGISIWDPPPGSRPPIVNPRPSKRSSPPAVPEKRAVEKTQQEPRGTAGREVKREERRKGREERPADAKPRRSRAKRSSPRSRSKRAAKEQQKSRKKPSPSGRAAPAPRSAPANGVAFPTFVDSRRAATTRRSRSRPRSRSASRPRRRAKPLLVEAKRERSRSADASDSRSGSRRSSRSRSRRRGKRPALELRPRDGSCPRSPSSFRKRGRGLRSASGSAAGRRTSDWQSGGGGWQSRVEGKDDGAWNDSSGSWKDSDSKEWRDWKPSKGPDAPQWNEPRTRAPPGKQVHLPGVVGNDEGLRTWLKTEASDHLEQFNGAALECIDVSGNNLTDRGASMLARFLLEKRLPTRRLMLFKNRLENPSDICNLLEDSDCGVGSRDGLSELHLSHNFVTSEFLGSVLTSVAKRVKEVGKLRPPMWLRVERNGDLKSDADAGRRLERPGLQICFEARCKQSGCTLRRCKQGADVHIVFAAGKG